jgi:phosphocarrier protein HPr
MKDISGGRQMERKIVVTNEKGIHIRPAGDIAKLVKNFKSTVEIEFNGKKANTKSVMILMSLNVKKGNEIKIIANGEDAEEAINALAALIESGFGEQ